MARSGILFSDVCRAAEKIQESGTSPTVDNVRQAMGNTGSKSTIAPMLKRWKEENNAQLKAINSGLPESILNAVRGVYELINAEAGGRIDALSTRHQEELDALNVNLSNIKNEAKVLANENDELNKLIASMTAERNTLLKDQQSDRLRLAALESEKSGMQHRIVDGENQIKALHHQLNSARAQFEHYQQASATQRSEERQSFESRINRLEQELSHAKLGNAELQSANTKQAAETHHLMNSLARMKDIAQVQLEELSKSEDLLQKNQFQLAEKEVRNTELTRALENSQTALAEHQIALAVALEKQEQFKQQLQHYELAKNDAEHERLELLKLIIQQQQMAASNANDHHREQKND